MTAPSAPASHLQRNHRCGPYAEVVTTMADVPESVAELEREVFEHQTSITRRRSFKNIKGCSTPVWPHNVEAALLEGLYQYCTLYGADKKMQKRKGFQHCNTFVADFITAHTTEIRTSRQVASRLQYLGSATRDPRSDSWFDLSFGTAIVDIPLVIELIRHRRILEVKPFVTKWDNVNFSNSKLIQIPHTVQSQSARYQAGAESRRIEGVPGQNHDAFVPENGLEFALSYPPEAGDTSRTIAPNLDEEACPLVRQRGTSSLETDVNGMCGKFAYLASPNYNSSVTNTSSLVQWDKLLDGPTGTSHFGALPFVGLPAVIPSGHLKESEQSFSFPLSMQYV